MSNNINFKKQIESFLSKSGFQNIKDVSDTEMVFSDGSRIIPVLVQNSKPVVSNLKDAALGFRIHSEVFSQLENTSVHLFVFNELSKDWLYSAVQSHEVDPWNETEEDYRPFNINQFSNITGYVSGEYPATEFELGSIKLQEKAYA